IIDEAQAAGLTAKETFFQMPGPIARRLPSRAQLGPVPGDHVPLDMTRLLGPIEVQQALPTFDLDDFDIRQRLADLASPFVDELTRAEHQPSIRPPGGMGVDCSKTDERLAHAHFA